MSRAHAEAERAASPRPAAASPLPSVASSRPSAAARPRPLAGRGTAVLELQRAAGNRAVAHLLATQREDVASAPQTPLAQRCGPGGCACGGTCGGEEDFGPVQRTVDPALGSALDEGRFPGSAAAHPPLLSTMDIFNRLNPDDRRDTVRALNPTQQQAFMRSNLGARDDALWRVIIECTATEVRTAAVRALMAAGRMNEPQAPWGAYGVLNGLSSTDQLAVINQLFDPERQRLRQGLATAPINRERMEENLASANPDEVPPIRSVSFPITWVARELPQRGAGAAAPSLYMGSQGAHAIGATPIQSGMRLIGTDYWRAFIPARRAVELQRGLDQLPRDLQPWFTTHMAQTPPGAQPAFQWVSDDFGRMSRPFTVNELESIPALVRKFNTTPNALSPAELTLLSRTISLHVGGAHRGGSPWSSWSAPPRPGQADPISFMGTKQFVVRADFQPRDILDNTRATAANTLGPQDQGVFEPPLNADEAEFLATAESDARVLTVVPRGAVSGELVSGSAEWMARNAAELRWAGRGMLVVSFAISGFRIATATEGQRAHVIGEEAGAQLLGWGGAVAAGAACVAFGIATGGVGLLLCGMAGGLAGGMLGSAIGGATVDALGRPAAAPADPFGLYGGPGGPASRASGAWLLAAPPEVLDY